MGSVATLAAVVVAWLLLHRHMRRADTRVVIPLQRLDIVLRAVTVAFEDAARQMRLLAEAFRVSIIAAAEAAEPIIRGLTDGR